MRAFAPPVYMYRLFAASMVPARPSEIGDGARRTAQTASERERRLQWMNASVREIHTAENAMEMGDGGARMPGSK